MSANWVTTAANLAGATLDMFNTMNSAATSRTMGGISDRLTREQIRIQSEADAAARVRATGNLISAQRAAIGASGVAGGRTARLLEARSRINAGREQLQADQSRRFAEASSRINRIQNRIRARSAVWRSAQNLLVEAASSVGGGGG